MMEIDWNSLFSNFFSMVRVKIACMDSSKIPKKRLFEMNNNLYVRQFKVEGGSNVGQEDGDEDGGDNEEPGNEDDTGMEEFQHDPVPQHKKTKDKGQNSSGTNQLQRGGSGSSNGPSSSKGVATWMSLFQTNVENISLASSELGQYSCIKLLLRNGTP
jgi:hypothetical protein